MAPAGRVTVGPLLWEDMKQPVYERGRCLKHAHFWRRSAVNVIFFRSSANKEICDLEAIRRAVKFYMNFVISMPRTMTS